MGTALRLGPLLAGLLTLLIWLTPGAAAAAEVLAVRSATLLQVGDSNRTYTVELACLAVAPEQQQQALAWMRRELPRRSRVNLRPLGSHDGILLARVQKLGSATDLASGLIAAGQASDQTDAPGCGSYPNLS
jgi:cell division inhibitor SulA